MVLLCRTSTASRYESRLLSIISLIFLLRGSLVKGGRPFSVPRSLAGCVRYDEIRGQRVIALKHAKRRTVFRAIRPTHYSSSRQPHRRQSYGFAAAIVSKHYTHASVNICACSHARMFVPPAFVVKAR